jgi:hypothetical protein
MAMTGPRDHEAQRLAQLRHTGNDLSAAVSATEGRVARDHLATVGLGRTAAVLGALAPSLAMIGAGLDQGVPSRVSWWTNRGARAVLRVTDSWVATLGQLALLVLGPGPAGVGPARARRATLGYSRCFSPQLSGSCLDAHAGTMLETAVALHFPGRARFGPCPHTLARARGSAVVSAGPAAV